MEDKLKRHLIESFREKYHRSKKKAKSEVLEEVCRQLASTLADSIDGVLFLSFLSSITLQRDNGYDDKCRAKLNFSQIKYLNARHLFNRIVRQRVQNLS